MCGHRPPAEDVGARCRCLNVHLQMRCRLRGAGPSWLRWVNDASAPRSHASTRGPWHLIFATSDRDKLTEPVAWNSTPSPFAPAGPGQPVVVPVVGLARGHHVLKVIMSILLCSRPSDNRSDASVAGERLDAEAAPAPCLQRRLRRSQDPVQSQRPSPRRRPFRRPGRGRRAALDALGGLRGLRRGDSELVSGSRPPGTARRDEHVMFVTSNPRARAAGPWRRWTWWLRWASW